MNAPTLGRRRFVVLAGSAFGGLTLGLVVGEAQAATDVAAVPLAGTASFAQPFLRIDSAGIVTVLVKHLDMGQGTWTGLPSIVAEELDCRWADVRVEGAPADRVLYKQIDWGVQSTGGSTSTSNSWQQLRVAGATARAMLVASAAARWGVPVERVRVEAGVVSDGRTHHAGFGELAGAAALLPVPAGVALKNKDDFKLLGQGRPRLPRLDSVAKCHGAPLFGIDMERPGMKVAVMQRPPSFGAVLATLDDAAARAVPGVRDVLRVPGGVAVVADHTWAALQGRRALTLTWDESAAERRSSAEIAAEFKRLAASDEGLIALDRGTVAAAFATAEPSRIVEAEFALPYLAHAAMEPLCSVGEIRDGACDVWAGFQNQTADQAALARILGLPLDRVRLHSLYAGGSFGRRATFRSDWISELAELLKATGGTVPIKLMWSREDDLCGGYYRPANVHRLRAVLAADGSIAAIDQVIVAQSFGGQPKPGTAQRLDIYAIEGHFAERYDVANARLRWINPKVGVPVHTWRALSFNHTSFTKEVFVDLLARRAGRDPLEYRLAHLKGHPRQAAVLKLAAEKAGWGRPLPTGRAFGLAVQQANNGTFVAQVAEVRLAGVEPRVERVVCALDCGYAINPDIVLAQTEGGIGDGLGAALFGQLTLDGGHVVQGNFDTYRLLRMPQMPRVELHLLDGGDAPTGVGEPTSVVVGAAVVNALARLGAPTPSALPLVTA